MFSARQGKNEGIASWGNQIDELQTDLREAARRVCKREEILGSHRFDQPFSLFYTRPI